MTLRATATLALPLIVLAITTGCHGDFTSSTGELGMLTYGLATDYESDQGELTDLPLITGYHHRIEVGLTDKGDKKADDDAGLITHRAAAAEVTAMDPDEERSTVADFEILARQAGEVMVESMLDGELFDRIELAFDHPTHLDLVTWSREPWEGDFEDEPGDVALTVQEGAQISFLAIPMADDTRLGGDFTPQIDADPAELVVPDEQIYAVQEGGLTKGGEPVTFYAIDPGTVRFTLSDPVHGVEVIKTVHILPVGEEDAAR